MSTRARGCYPAGPGQVEAPDIESPGRTRSDPSGLRRERRLYRKYFGDHHRDHSDPTLEDQCDLIRHRCPVHCRETFGDDGQSSRRRSVGRSSHNRISRRDHERRDSPLDQERLTTKPQRFAVSRHSTAKGGGTAALRPADCPLEDRRSIKPIPRCRRSQAASLGTNDVSQTAPTVFATKRNRLQRRIVRWLGMRMAYDNAGSAGTTFDPTTREDISIRNSNDRPLRASPIS